MPRSFAFTLAQAQTPTPAQRQKVQSAATLTLIAILLIITVGACALVLLSRYRRRVLARTAPRKSKPPVPDPWHEAGRRAQPGPDPSLPGSDDDTVDIDPDQPRPPD